MLKTSSDPYDWVGFERRHRLLTVDDRCTYCRKPLSIFTATQDHVIPVSKGGADEDDNIVLACYRCNSSKSDMLPLNFFMSPYVQCVRSAL